MLLVAWLLAAFGIGVPAHAEVIVPAITLPPADAYHDIGAVTLAGLSEGSIWVARGLLAAARTTAIAWLACLAVDRARDLPVAPAAAVATLRTRWRTFGVLGGVSFGYGLLVSQQGPLDPGRDASVAAAALTVGMLVLPGAFVAAAMDRGAGRALARGFATRRPVGHVLLVVGYGLAVNGLYRLASFGEPGRPRALPLALYGVIAAWASTVALLTLARRAVLLEAAARTPDPAAEAPDGPAISVPKARNRR